MLETVTLLIALAALATAGFGLHRQATRWRTTLERLQAIEQRLEALDEKTNTLASDWTAAFGNVETKWADHIERVTDNVTTKLSFQNTKHRTSTR